MNKSVLVIAAHMDDETLGVGGTLLKLKEQGYITNVCIVTNRAYNHEYDTKKIAIEKENCKNACKILKVDNIYFLEQKDERLDELLLNSIIPIEEIIDKIKPEIVFTNFLGDTNQDHQSVFRASMIATRTFSKDFIKKIFCYEVLSSTEQSPFSIYPNFKPNYYFDIEKYIEQKKQAFKCYIKESRNFPHPRSIEGIEILSKYRGMESGYNNAEGFLLIKGRE